MSNPTDTESQAYEKGKVQTGEYMVHIHIQESRGLVNPGDNESTLNPIIKSTVWGKTKLSKVKKEVGTGQTYWGEHFFHDTKIEDAIELENGKITLTVMDFSKLLKNSLIGSFEIEMMSIFLSEKRVMMHKWVALTNVEKSVDKIMGFLKISVSILGPGDNQVPLEDEKITETGAPSSSDQNVLFPPQYKVSPHQLVFKIFRGENIKKTDFIGSVDPFMEFEFCSMVIPCKVMKNNRNPNWMQKLILPISLPTVNDTITGRLRDYNELGKNELMGSFKLSFKEIQAKKYVNPFWVNIYGAQPGSKEKWEKLMSNNSELGTDWKGRVLMSVYAEEASPEAIAKQEDLNAQENEDFTRKQTLASRFELKAEAHFGMYLPEEGKKYSLVLRWGIYEVISTKIECKRGLSEWYEPFRPIVMELQGTVEELPDVFLYLRQGSDTIISYYRRPAKWFIDRGGKAQTEFFMPEKSTSKIRDDQGGIVRFRVDIASSTGAVTTQMSQSASKSAGRPYYELGGLRPNFQMATLAVNMFQGADLVPGDATGTSDPFATVHYYGVEAKTNKIDQSLNPLWNQKVVLNALVDPQNLENSPPVVITIWDWDGGGDHDFMGYVIIPVKTYATDWNTPTIPEWKDVKLDAKTKFGRVLVSVDLYQGPPPFPMGNSPTKLMPLTPPTERCMVRVTVFGMRNLQSRGVLPVKRPFIEMDVKNIRGPKERDNPQLKQKVQTPLSEGGANPNIGAMVTFEVDLPILPNYCPALSCRVLDYLFKGISTPLIGMFSVELGKYKEKTKQTVEQAIASARKAIQDKQNKAYQAQQQQNTINQEKKMDLEKGNTNQKTNGGGYQQLNDQEDDDGVFHADSIDPKEKKGLVLLPKYQYSKELDMTHEVDAPDDKTHLPLGYNTKAKKDSKHYRKYLPTELENSIFGGAPPLEVIPIYRGQKIGDTSFFEKLLRKENETFQQVGTFKGKVDVFSLTDMKRLEEETKGTFEDDYRKKIEKEFLTKTDVLVRIYVVDAYELPPKDSDSDSDPFLKIKLGKQKYNGVKEHFDDTNHPNFGKMVEFNTQLPGPSELEVEVWDYDGLGDHDLIGKTTIDVENRFFSKRFRKLNEIPIETRPLMNPGSSIKQGMVRLWVEIYPRDDKRLKANPVWEIAQKPPTDFELRVIVWEIEDIPTMDWEGASDLYVSAQPYGCETQKTDTHIRSQNGKGSYNWRLIFPVKLPMKSHTISFKVFDKDLVSGDDYACEATLDFSREAKLAFENDFRVKLKDPQDKKETKFWIPCTRVASKEDGGKIEKKGQIEVSVELIPLSEAKSHKVGTGRSEPNTDPYLPPPTGRISLSLNPFKLFEQLIGPVARMKVCMIFCCGLCCLLLLILGPSFLGSVMANMFF